MARDYYAVLGVDKNASDSEIRRAYRKLARELHPDVNPSDEARERFTEVTAVYEVLSDPERRRIVDMGGDPLDSSSPGGPGGGFGAGGFGGFGDVFEAFFGGGGGGGRGPRSRVQPGSDTHLRVSLTLAECAAGVTRNLEVDTAVLCSTCNGRGTAGDTEPTTCGMCHGQGEIQSVQRSMLGNILTARVCPTCSGTGEVITDPCGSCHGQGRVRERVTLSAEIPAGIGDGMRIRLAGKGEVGPGGGPAGDVFVEVRQKPHPVFVRAGDDLHCTVRVPLADAVLGSEVTVTSVLDEELTVRIPAGTQHGHTEVLSGRGLPNVHGRGTGDLTVHMEVVVPEHPDRRYRELVEELRRLDSAVPEVVDSSSPHRGGLFSRLRDAFSGR